MNDVAAANARIQAWGALPAGEWLPIERYIDGFHAVFWWPRGERGAGGMESAMLFRDLDWSYWTHGGPNSGSDWEPRDHERPTLFMKIERPAP